MNARALGLAGMVTVLGIAASMQYSTEGAMHKNPHKFSTTRFSFQNRTVPSFSKPVSHNPGTKVIENKNVVSVAENTKAAIRMEGYKRRLAMQKSSLLQNLNFRSVGPTIMSGRVTDIDANAANPLTFYVGYASGGLWRTENNGMSFTPLFENQASMTIGDIAVDWKHGEVIWVGTGENNSSRSSYAGTGVYKSADRGKSWQHLGLEETHHIGRILIHPEKPETVWVAALGHLYSENAERGVYKTIDGGATWEKSLFINDSTGIVDLIIDPTNSDVLYAAAWERTRHSWDFKGNGKGSGIYKSVDGGASWKRLTEQGSGFPAGNGVGRIGLDISPQNPSTIFALLDNQDRRPAEKSKTEQLKATDIRKMSRDDFLKLPNDKLNSFLRGNRFPAKYKAKKIKHKVESLKIAHTALADYIENPNARHFDTPVIGAEVYRSDDGGETWKRTHEGYIDGLYSSYGYYFGEIRVAANDDDRLYITGVPLLASKDGGKTWESLGKSNVHGDHQALWLNSARPGHLINGNDGGLNLTYDDGANWSKLNSPAVGQFYAIAVDMAKPYNVYGGLQDNGVWMGPSSYKASPRWHSSGRYPYQRLYGGDGMQVEVDTRDNTTVYTGSQFGFYARINTVSHDRKSVRPTHKLGEHPLRFNWQTPIKLSTHNQDIFYIGSNRLYRSMDKGKTLQPISEDLTTGGKVGNVPYGTLTSIDESPLRFGLLYVGSDDGLVHMTDAGGHVWKNISDGLPKHLWVSRVEASPHNEGTVFVSLNGYRDDDFAPYLYKSENYGESWKQIGLDLPFEPINVVVQDPENRHILYVGTDHALYVSLNGGKSFMGVSSSLPGVPVHDVVVQARDKDLVVGTHGRSIYIADLEHVQQLTSEMIDQALHLFPVKKQTHSSAWGRKRASWRTANEPGAEIVYYTVSSTSATISLKTEEGLVLKSLTDESEQGLNYVQYDFSVSHDRVDAWAVALNDTTAAEAGAEKAATVELKPADNGKVYLLPGTYVLEIESNGYKKTQKLIIEKSRRRNR